MAVFSSLRTVNAIYFLRVLYTYYLIHSKIKFKIKIMYKQFQDEKQKIIIVQCRDNILKFFIILYLDTFFLQK